VVNFYSLSISINVLKEKIYIYTYFFNVNHLQVFEIDIFHEILEKICVLVCQINICDWPVSDGLRNTVPKDLSLLWAEALKEPKLVTTKDFIRCNLVKPRYSASVCSTQRMALQHGWQ
jgi:hypothetical protein